MIVIVPDSLRHAINRKLDEAIAACPGAEVDRSVLYKEILAYFNEHGELPVFIIEPNTPTP